MVIVETQGDSSDEFKAYSLLSPKIDKYLKKIDDWAVVLSGQLYTETLLSQDYQKDMYWSKTHERLKASPATCITSCLRDHFRLIGSAQIRKIIKAIRDNVTILWSLNTIRTQSWLIRNRGMMTAYWTRQLRERFIIGR